MKEQVFFWKKTLNQLSLEEKDKEIERLNDYILFYEDLSRKQNKEIERLKKQSNNYAKRIIKAIEYIEKHTNRLVEYLDVFEAQDLVNILQGVDKE